MKKPPDPPELGPEFAGSGSPKPKPSPSPAYADPDDDLDHHDLSTWDYTPGGTIEQIVHTRISNANRDAYRKSMSPQDEPEHEDHYRQLMSDEFERSAAALEREHNEREQQDAHDLDPAALRAQIDQQLARIGPDFSAASPGRGPDGPSR